MNSLHPVHFKYFTEEDRIALGLLERSRSATFADVGALKARVVRRSPEKVHMVSGPITSGGLGSVEKNFEFFCAAIEYLHDAEGLNVFSQKPFEEVLHRLHEEWKAEHSEGGARYCTELLEGVYRPVFESGRVERLHFLLGYESSKGAVWEHDGCEGWGIDRRYIDVPASIRIFQRITGMVPSER